MIATAHHRAPTGLFLVLLVVVAILYVGWRSGGLGQLSRAVARSQSTRSGHRRLLPEGVRVRPVALIPTLVLAAVVAWLVLGRN